MRLSQLFTSMLTRFRYPFSRPEDIASDLGFVIPSNVGFNEFMDCLLDPSQTPRKLIRLMPRREAESIFLSANRKECFQQNSLFSYYFQGGWVEFILQFDGEFRLRRLYIRHKKLQHSHEIKITPYP